MKKEVSMETAQATLALSRAMKNETFIQSATEPVRLVDYKCGEHVAEVKNPPMSKSLEAELEAKKNKYIRHYTNFDSLLKILKYKSILCNRIDRVNDVDESMHLQVNQLSKRVFVSCFNKSERESIPLWFMYTPKGMGACLRFVFREDKTFGDIFDRNSIIRTNDNDVFVNWKNDDSIDELYLYYYKYMNVMYSNDDINCHSAILGESQHEIIYDAGMIGTTKKYAWGFEEETRFIALLDYGKHIDRVSCLFLPLDLTVLNMIEVTFDPWMTVETKDCLKHEIKRFLPDGLVSFKNSDFENKIKRE